MSTESPLPPSWTITSSDCDTYPMNTDMSLTETGEALYKVAWQGASLDRLARIKIGKAHVLRSDHAAGSDGQVYKVEIRVDAADRHLDATVVHSNGTDPGDLSGTWGADAKNYGG
jgi:hypothetical protein